jgi:hypothetical protein
MKKIIYSTVFAFIGALSMQAQNAIPNGNFETWTSGTFNVPTGYSGSNQSTFFQCNSPFNCVQSTDAYHGSYAVQLTTNVGSNDTCMGYIGNFNTNSGGNSPCQWKGGVPYNQKPTALRGYYKSNVVAGDSAGILVVFKQAGNCLGMYMKKFYGLHNTYTLFTINFSPALSATPDTMIIAAISSDVFDNIQKNGSMFQFDSLSFTGGVSQPAGFNGDFENWQSQTLNKPANWYINTDGSGDGVSQTTDAEAGNYAAELKSFLDFNKNGSITESSAGSISTGYYPNNCSGNCQQKGGNPFTHQIDTLAFYYKYTPVNNDTASTYINFKKSGNMVYGTGSTLLSTVGGPGYHYVEIPFNTGTAVDSVIVSFQSSSWRDTATAFVGSDLKIDEVHFKSQPLSTGIKLYDARTGINIFPNPSNDGAFVVSNIKTFDLIRVYNIYGQEVNAQIVKQADYANIQINNAGAYFVQVNSEGKVTTQKVIVSSN